MPWKYHTEDGKVEVIVEPEFKGDLIDRARVRPVWIVDTDGNRPIIDAAWLVGRDLDLFEVSRCKVDNPDDRVANLSMIMGSLDDHYAGYDMVIQGLAPNRSTEMALEEEGFRIAESMPDAIVAVRIPGVRERLIGWPETS